MDSERWERIQALFHDAVDLPPAEREAFLQAQCGGDAALLADVGAAIEEDRRAASLLDRGLDDAAKRVILNEAASLNEIGPYRIVRTLGEGDKTQAEVDFGGELGVKRFVLRFAPLEKI